MDIAYNKVDQTALPIDTTRVSASEYNQIAGSLMSIISASGLTPDSADNTQLLNALKAMGSGWAMPSGDVYEDLTLGASGSTYTAPANGYISLLTSTSAAGGFFALYNGYYNVVAQHTVANYALTGVLPIRKGQTATLDYLNIATPTHFKFIYAEGSRSEAN